MTARTASPPTGQSQQDAACRIYAILAGDGRSAVVFRRGPSKAVLVLRWWLDRDVIEEGQWFKGRIYERRCDVSHDGDLLLAFCAKWSTPHVTWTALSRTPYLTALAFWPKGDAWGGGGVFMGPRTIGLNYFEIGRALASKNTPRSWHPLGADPAADPVPKSYSIVRCADWAGRGEDGPIEGLRLERSGWRIIREGEAGKFGAEAGYAVLMIEPQVWSRPQPGKSAAKLGGLALQRFVRAIGERGGAWYVEDYSIVRADGGVLRTFTGASWADWSVDGDLLLALNGCLYRLPAKSCKVATDEPLQDAKMVADLTQLRFTPRAPPDWAKQWP